MLKHLRRATQAVSRRTLLGRLAELERHSHGSRATYLGRNRVLVKCVVRGASIAYLVEADDRLLSPWFIITGGYETDLTRFLLGRMRPDHHCIDAGTNFGYFTCLMARFCPRGRVIGIEPDRRIFDLARDNIAINGFGHAMVMQAAVGDGGGEMTLHRRHSRSGNTSIIAVGTDLTEALGEPPAEPFTAPIVRIDSLAERMGGRVDIMKIDVEGAEPLAIAGAARTIAANPQLAIVMEWSPGQIVGAGFDLREFLGSLAGLGLRAADLVRGRPRPLSYDELVNLPYRAGIVLQR